MFINPISTGLPSVENLPSLFENNKQVANTTNETGAFSDIFSEIYKEYEDSQVQLQADSIGLINGEIDDLATIYNNMTKASIAVETFVAVKNATVNAYNQIIQTQM
jgi:flagellar hook-basal body complex protein FliE